MKPLISKILFNQRGFIQRLSQQSGGGEPPPEFSADVWVAKAGDGGSDSNDGLSESTPKLTINAGYTVLSGIGVGKKMAIKQGAYTENISFIPPSGSSGNLNQIVAYPGHAVTYHATNNNALLGPTTYVYFERIIFQGGHNVDGATHCWFHQCEITGSTTSGLQLNHDNGDGDFNLFSYCLIHDNCIGGGTPGPDHGVYCRNPNNTFDHCELYNNGESTNLLGEPFHFHFADGGSTNVHDNIVRYCEIRNGNSGSGWAAGGMLISDGANNIAYNNLIYANPGDGVFIYNNGGTAKLYNNTIYGNGGVGEYNYASGAAWTNNISYNNTGGNRSGSGTFTTDDASGTNPQFQNEGGGDFHLTSGSPSNLKDGGTDLSSIGGFNDDFYGTSRPLGSGWSIGAAEI